MIAHRIERKSGKDAFGRLACYITDVENTKDPKVFERLASYVVDRANGGERVVGMQISNCASEDFAMAVKEIEATQALNTRAKGDKSYHLVVSFPEGERPTLDQLRDIEEKLIASIGYSDHQRVSAIHDDTDNLHIHIAVNKVHPKTRRCVEPFFDKKRLMEACIELEVAHGLIRDNHGLNAEKRHSQGEQKMQAHSGRESLRQWVEANAKEQIVSQAGAAKSWSDLHRALADVGLQIRPYGAGMVIGPPGSKVTLKASDIDRSLAIKALVDRLGKYQPPAPDVASIAPSKSYKPAPIQQTPEAKVLFERYQAERAASIAARDAARTKVSTEQAAYADKLRDFYKWRKAEIRGESRMTGTQRFDMLGDLRVERQRKWAEFKAGKAAAFEKATAAHPLPTWQSFLQREAEAGDEQALATLRQKSRATRRLSADILTAPDLAAAKTVIDKRYSARAGANGDMVYSVHDGGRLTDRAAEVRMDNLSTGAALLALNLAKTRFGGQALVLDGTDEFKRAVIEVSALAGFDITFADPVLETARLEAIRAREAAERSRPAPGSPQEYIAQRNQAREDIAAIPAHRLWQAADTGKFVYSGKRTFANGSEAILLERDGEIFVKPMSEKQVAMATHWPRGKTLHLDGKGRVSMSAPAAAEKQKGPTLE